MTEGTKSAAPPRRVQRLPRLLLVGLVVVALLAGLLVWAVGAGALELRQGGRATLGAGPVEGTILVGPASGTEEQRGVCDGMPEPVALVSLERPLDVSAVVVCRPETGSDDVTVLAQDEPSEVSELVAALAEPDEQHWGASVSCLAYLAMPPSFVLRLVGGERIRPALPIDVCGFPSQRADAALSRLLPEQ